MKVIIGLVGPPLAGKETVGGLTDEWGKENNLTVSRHRFRDILEETLKLWGIERNRPNLQKMAQIMVRDDAFGPDALANAVRNRLMNDPAQIVVADGVRWLADEALLRSFPAADSPDVKGLILYITADEQVRYERLKSRRREGEHSTSFEEFRKQGMAKNEIYIPQVGSRADYTIENNGTEAELKEKMREFCEKKVQPILENQLKGLETT